MASAFRKLSHLAIPLLLLSGSAMAQAQASDPALKLIRGGGTPAVFKPGQPVLPASSCPAIVNVSAGDIQPMRLPPDEVAAKNKLGCLSPNDAIYGPDGCPTRLCGQAQGAVPLPAGDGLSQRRQLPEP
ncbi:hypothetical protein KUL97_02460 [Synechococcus sp. HK05]|uniref:hypothetical protein n=1 Tax=Synechococcus sp. HK05 TaxID=2725975 RepID=UPI001C38B87C|nr:hypothetical protein [Synechococcus sp. HK05]MBV2350565.1 hypothetical protein [Synechococcus sp. HK05]